MAFGKKKEKRSSQDIMRLNSDTDFIRAEAYKTLRTNLMFTLWKQGCKRVIVTSALPKEGKSTSCCNLGITLAQTSSKVLIIDCDLRKPMLHKFFEQQGIPGLSEVLAGMATAAEAIHKTAYPNLKILCGGTTPPNPMELICSSAMSDLLDALSKEFDYILLDTAPVNLVADALALSPMTDGAILVVRQGETPHANLQHALSDLEFAHVKILGIVLNAVKSGHHYGSSKYNFRGYYGDYKYQNSTRV